MLHLGQNGKESGYSDWDHGTANGRAVPGLKMAPTASLSILDTELGNPYPPLKRGMEVVRPINGGDGTGCPKKRMPASNRQDRGSYLDLKGC